MIEIEKGIPIPPCKYGNSDQVLDMDIGDSFLYPDSTMSQARGICGKAHKAGYRFAVRKQEDDSGNLLGYRVWRVK